MALFLPALAQATPPSVQSAHPVPTCEAPTNPPLGDHAILRDCADTPELIAIPGGDFRMGDQLGNGYSYERPVHAVHVDAFLMGRYEVSVAEWQSCVRSSMCSAEAGGEDHEPKHPVSSVSWDEAQQFVAWLSRKTGRPYRLPSEAEWEYAARAGSADEFTWGNNETAICEYANIFDVSGRIANPEWTWSVGCDDGFAKAAPVGSFPPNAWGLYDMLGNVWEWVADCWHSDYEGAPNNGAPWVEAACPKRVNRGGGWGNHARTTRVSTRDADAHGAGSNGLGFRIARSIIYATPRPAPAPPAAVVPAGPPPTRN